MSESKQEEIIGVLWLIAAVTAFGNGYTYWAWVFAVKAAFDIACSIVRAIQAVLERQKNAKVRK